MAWISGMLTGRATSCHAPLTLPAVRQATTRWPESGRGFLPAGRTSAKHQKKDEQHYCLELFAQAPIFQDLAIAHLSRVDEEPNRARLELSARAVARPDMLTGNEALARQSCSLACSVFEW